MSVALNGILAPLNSTMLLVALPQIGADLRASPSQTSWLVTSYLVAMAATLAVGGHLGDRYGRRRVILTGLVAFGLASLAAAAAPNLLVAVVARVCQAAASSVVFPSGAALLREVVPDQRRGRAFGKVGAALSIAAAIGPLAGSALVGLQSWRLVFLVNIPIVAAALYLTNRAVPARREQSRQGSLDVAGVVLLSVTLSGLAVLLSLGIKLGYRAAALAIGVVAGAAALLRHEAGRREPALRLDLFGAPAFATACVGVALSNFAMYSTLIVMPLALAGRPGWNTTGSGILLASLSSGSVLMSPVGGRLADHLGRRAPAVAGMALSALALALVALPGSGLVQLSLLLGLAGCGFGLAGAGFQVTAVEAVAPSAAGAAAGLYSTCRYLGSLVGSSLLAAELSLMGTRDVLPPVMAVLATSALLASAAAARLPSRRPSVSNLHPKPVPASEQPAGSDLL